MHTLGAGERARASTYAEAAAEGAASKLAFDQAARLFRMALDTAGADAGARAQALRVRIAHALQQAGRLSASADAYREAAVGAASLERVQLEGASAGQMLRCGRIEEGIALLGRVLSAIGMSAPKSTIAAIFYLVVYRLAAAFVGRVVERDHGDVSTEDRIRLEALDSVAVGMGLVNVLLGACMQARHVLLAFRVGDRHQLLRAIGVRLIHFSISSRPLTRKELAMRARARALAEKVGPEGLALYHGAHGILLHLRGQMVASLAEFDAYRRLTSRVIEPNFPIFEVWSLIYAGRLRVAVPTAKRLLREVDQDGDVYTGVCLRCPAMIEISMIEDDPESGWRHLKEAVERWVPPGFTVQHWYVLVFGAHLHLYCGQAEAAYQRIASKMPALKKSLLLHAAPARRHTLYALGRAAIASANGLPASERERRLAEAGRCARALQRMGWPVDRFYAAVLRGALANARGRRDEAVAALRVAVALGDETGPLYAWTAQYQLGRLLGGEEGRALAAAAEEFFAVEGVRAPSRYAAAFVPGEWGPGSSAAEH
jgi:tetratricopeptide (TPR) repeat protein